MDPIEEMEYRRRRERMLILLFGTFLTAAILVTFTVISGGLFLVMLAVAGCMAFFGGIHYLLWGKILSEDTAGEREEYERERETMDQDDPRRPRHY